MLLLATKFTQVFKTMSIVLRCENIDASNKARSHKINLMVHLSQNFVVKPFTKT